jgi:hypothetical protein
LGSLSGNFRSAGAPDRVVGSTANTFFHDLNLILIQHLILQICKLTDSEATRGIRNLTTWFLLKNSDFSCTPSVPRKLTQLIKSLERFRKRLLPARNKFISHLDLDDSLARKALGRAPIGAWRQFWLDLQSFAEILQKRYVHTKFSFHLNAISGVSDANQLVKALKESRYFLDAWTITP